ncbi:hypothetical protein NP493_653g01083 [Ridgeia piscesae]|uniref:Ribosome assembly factor mrt4 n=1 Tax=Ridgeia piscesae TaxID=27915 RepID=A0AAD9KSB2_RIDPI|nr:hypothetical protein NP493_653g01083 [Ridgeia piscesae]
MPKSKRDKRVSLTQTRRKGLELKQKLIEDIRSCVDQYAHIFIFSVQNMRNNKLKDIRQEWRHSRFFFGKNKVTSVALGQTTESEYSDGLHELSKQLSGQMGLLFTNKSTDEVVKWFTTFKEPDYARSGNVAPQTVILEEGPLEGFSHSMEPQLRQLGLPTTLKRGVVTLIKEHPVCKIGDTLTPEQARILKLFGHKMADFHVTVEGVWSKKGAFKKLKSDIKPDTQTKSFTVKLKPSKVTPNDDISDDDMDDDDEGSDAT